MRKVCFLASRKEGEVDEVDGVEWRKGWGKKMGRIGRIGRIGRSELERKEHGRRDNAKCKTAK